MGRLIIALAVQLIPPPCVDDTIPWVLASKRPSAGGLVTSLMARDPARLELSPGDGRDADRRFEDGGIALLSGDDNFGHGGRRGRIATGLLRKARSGQRAGEKADDDRGHAGQQPPDQRTPRRGLVRR
jgi:hypothetical protein